jgi:SHS2 domain-containing protein
VTDFDLVEHTADIALRVRGRDFPALLANLAYAVGDQLAAAARVGRLLEVPVSLAAPDREALCVALANEIIYRREADGLLLPWLEVDGATETTLSGTLRGERAGETHDLRSGLKAATYHELSLRDTPSGLELFLVFDV